MEIPDTYKDHFEIRTNGYMYFKRNNARIGQVIQEVDGYYVIYLDDVSGFLSDWMLLGIGATLRELNEPWDKEVREYFDNES